MKCCLLFMPLLFAACTNDPRTKANTTSKTQSAKASADGTYNGIALPIELKEISGMTRDGENVWAISDAPTPVVYKLSKDGKIVHETSFDNIQVTDMESLTSDADYVYIADVGNNKGYRESRNVIRIPKAQLQKNSSATKGEVIRFTFEGEAERGENHNCEAMFAFNDSLYFFTKQTDGQTQMYVVSKQPGTRIAKKVGELHAGGMITGASINHAGNEVALVGYRKGHKHPFVVLIDGFVNNSFLAGKTTRYELDPQPRDWQVESISYVNDETLIFACEGTKDVIQTLYTINRNDLLQLPQNVPATAISDSKGEKKDKGKKKKKKKKNDAE